MKLNRVSEKDLVAKWRKPVSELQSQELPFKLLEIGLAFLSEDSRIDRAAVSLAIRNRDLSLLFSTLEKSVDVTEYASPDLLLQDRLFAELFSKYDFPDSPFSKREKAKIRYWTAEHMCKETNDRLRTLAGADYQIVSLIDRCQRHIRSILGRFDLDEMSRLAKFGPGACQGVSGAFTTSYFKYGAKEYTCSSSCVPYVEALYSSDYFWKALAAQIDLAHVDGPFNLANAELNPVVSTTEANKVTFVPKNAKTDRSIAIEPFFNIYFQLGIGGMLRRRLRRHGVNLDDQSRNQMLAKAASVNGDLATVDFSMASDTVSRSLVKLLLPREWYFHLDNLRSKFSTLDGVTFINEKFSTMGNGYTFELESLIFFSMALSVCEELGISTERISVFGDDVLIPAQAYELFLGLATYLGFKVNEEKTFFQGYFRESCGEDFLKGVPVRPVFCKEIRTISDIGSLSNRLLELNRSVGAGSRLNRIIGEWVAFLRARIPRDVRKHLVGPPSECVDGYLFEYGIIDSALVRYQPKLFAWSYPTVTFRPKQLIRRGSPVRMMLNDTLKGSGAFNNALLRWGYFDPLLRRTVHGWQSDSVVTTITGRKVGNYVLGRSLAWSLG